MLKVINYCDSEIGFGVKNLLQLQRSFPEAGSELTAVLKESANGQQQKTR